MPYRILIFNQRPLGQFSAADLLEDLKAVHFSTLCRQYGLDSALINPAMNDLVVEKAMDDRVPFFIVRYQPSHQTPIIVTRQDREDFGGRHGLADCFEANLPPSSRTQLICSRDVYSVALVDSQIQDLGLLLAYEIARWVAHRGAGLVFGLDGGWYHLNAHQAFIPMG